MGHQGRFVRLGLCIQSEYLVCNVSLLLAFFEAAYNICVIPRKANLAETMHPKGAWFSPRFACLCIKAWLASSALGENHAPLGCMVSLKRPFKCAWFSQ